MGKTIQQHQGPGKTARPLRKLTKRTVDSLEAGARKGSWHADAELTGFFVVSYGSGKKVFFVRYRSPGGRRRVVKVGRYGALTVEQAREKARALLAAAELGEDPGAKKAAARRMPTFGEWSAAYLAHVAKTKKSPSNDVRFLEQTADRWGGRSLDSIEPREVDAFRQAIVRDVADRWADRHDGETALLTLGHTQANRWLASVRACFADAVRAGILRSNPAASLRPYREAPPRARVLSADELERLLRELENENDPHARAAIRMLVETGARLTEVLRAKWEDFDFESGTWRIPSPKAGYPQVLPLPSATAAMLRRLPRVGPYVIVGRDPASPRADLKGPWERLLEAAELEDVHIHDLRRTFGLAVARTAGLHVASKLLRHGDVRITERVYAPLGLEDLRVAINRRADVLPFAEKKKAETA